MEELETNTESVIKSYLSQSNADYCLVVLSILHKLKDITIEDELDIYINSPTDIMDDTARGMSILGILIEHGIDMLNMLGLYASNDFQPSIRLVSNILLTLTTLDELPISTSIYLLSVKDDLSDFDFLLQLLNVNEDMDILDIPYFIREVSPTFILAVVQALSNNLIEEDVNPLTIDYDNIDKQMDILKYLKDHLLIPIPDTIIKTLLNIEYKDGINDTYISDIIKAIPLDSERYDDKDKLHRYLLDVATDLLYCYKVNLEEEYLLTALDAIQPYMENRDIPIFNKKLINFDSICKNAKLYDYIEGTNHVK